MKAVSKGEMKCERVAGEPVMRRQSACYRRSVEGGRNTNHVHFALVGATTLEGIFSLLHFSVSNPHGYTSLLSVASGLEEFLFLDSTQQ